MVRVKQQIDVIQCPKYGTEYGTQIRYPESGMLIKSRLG